VIPLLSAPSLPGEEDAIGASLAKLVLYDWRDLPELEHKALMVMALTALDEPTGEHPAATYWGGHLRIAQSYRTWPDDDSRDRSGVPHAPKARARLRRNILREVRRAVDGLEARGAVKVADPSRATAPGVSQAYVLTLRREKT
jgi:hypothetical protein